jgi:hypothetical protein
MQESENFPLDDAAIDTVAELDEEERKLDITRANINVARSAVLHYFLRQHKMLGNWQLAPNRRELVRIEQPQPAIAPTPPVE